MEGLSNINLNSLVDNYGPMVTAICHRMIQNHEDARDVEQDVWLKIINGISEYRGEAKLSTWVYTVTYHAIINFARKEKLYTTKFLRNNFHEAQFEIPYEIDFDKEIWIKDMCDKCLTGVLHCLDSHSRMAYLFRDVAELPYKTISMIMNIDQVSIRKDVSRSRKKLNNFLNSECKLYNPTGSCRCRMKNLVTEIKLDEEYTKIRKLTENINLYLESLKILAKKNIEKMPD